jgi:hypothetical protein
MKHRLLLGAGAVLVASCVCLARPVNAREDAANAQAAAGTQTFTGILEANMDNRDYEYSFVLYDEATHENYYLRDQKVLDRLVGDRVQVVGTLNRSDTAIRVESLKPVH